MSPPPPRRSSLRTLGPGRRQCFCSQSLLIPQEMHRGNRGRRVFKATQTWMPMLGRLCSPFTWRNGDRRTLSEGSCEKEKQ